MAEKNTEKKQEHKDDLAFGGQAVIEGVMMRSNNYLTVAVRQKGKIISKTDKLPKRNKILRWPFIRGVVNLVDMLYVGINALLWSADQQLEKEEKISKLEIIITLVISISAAVLLFIVAPYFLTVLTKTKGVLFNLIDGLIRVIVFIIYLVAISRMKDVKVLFQYHGAEHKAVHCHEARKELTVKNVQRESTRHPRCGTSFIFIVLVISIIVFSVVTSESNWIKLGSRIVLLPVIAAISYELLKLTAKFQKNRIVGLVSMPGLWIQRITTKEPTDAQVEVAIEALKGVIGKEGAK